LYFCGIIIYLLVRPGQIRDGAQRQHATTAFYQIPLGGLDLRGALAAKESYRAALG